MRSLTIAVLVVTAVLLGFVQVVSDVLARSAAQPVSLVNLLPASVDDRLLVLTSQRVLAARDALTGENVSYPQDEIDTRKLIAALPPSRDRSALEGALAESHGDLHTAAREYAAADDYESLERIVVRADHNGDRTWARELQSAIIQRLRSDRTHLDAYAEAWWQLGLLDAEAGAAHRALYAYERAHALAPFNQKYLLNAGYQAFALHDLTRAGALFASSYDADPGNVSALVGLAEVALQSGRRTRAIDYLQRAQHLDAASPDVERLAQQLRE